MSDAAAQTQEAPDPRLCADAYGVILGAAMPGAIANVTLLRSQAAGHG